jgi:hypothetical protein
VRFGMYFAPALAMLTRLRNRFGVQGSIGNAIVLFVYISIESWLHGVRSYFRVSVFSHAVLKQPWKQLPFAASSTNTSIHHNKFAYSLLF